MSTRAFDEEICNLLKVLDSFAASSFTVEELRVILPPPPSIPEVYGAPSGTGLMPPPERLLMLRRICERFFPIVQTGKGGG